MNGGFALFSQGTLDDRVSAGAPFEEAVCGAAVEVTVVAVIALLGEVEDTVAAECGGFAEEERFQSAATVTAVSVGDVAVVTLFLVLPDTVAAGRKGGNQLLLPLATTGATVAVCAIAVVTLLLRRFDNAVAAVSEILPLTQNGAAVAIDEVAVARPTDGRIGQVALFALIEEPIPAAGVQLCLSAAERGAAIAAKEVRIVALFSCLGDAVAAEGGGAESIQTDLPAMAETRVTAGQTSSVHTQSGVALVVLRAGNANAVRTEAGDTLVILRAGQAASVTADLTAVAVVRGFAGQADPVDTKIGGALRIIRTGQANAIFTKVCGTLAVIGTGGGGAATAP